MNSFFVTILGGNVTLEQAIKKLFGDFPIILDLLIKPEIRVD